jgi:hypothetical protein
MCTLPYWLWQLNVVGWTTYIQCISTGTIVMIAIVNLAIVDYCHYRISKMALLCFHSIFTSCEAV